MDHLAAAHRSFNCIRQVAPTCALSGGFFGPHAFVLPKGISIGSSAFAGFTGMPNTQTRERATSVK